MITPELDRERFWMDLKQEVVVLVLEFSEKRKLSAQYPLEKGRGKK